MPLTRWTRRMRGRVPCPTFSFFRGSAGGWGRRVGSGVGYAALPAAAAAAFFALTAAAISLKHLRPGPGAGPGDGGGGVGPGGVGPGGVGPPPHAGPLCLKYESTEAQLVGAVHVCDRRQLVLPFTEVATMKLVHSGSARQFAAHADFGTLSPSSIV